jgi:DNA sulfur modification protein DndD
VDAQFVACGVGLPGHAGSQLSAGGRVKQGSRAAAVGQRRHRAAGALALEQLVDKGKRHAEAGCYLTKRAVSRCTRSGYPFAQIFRVRFHAAKKTLAVHTDHETALSKAYSEILGIKKYEDAKHEIEETQVRLRKRTADSKDREQLNMLEAMVENHKATIEDHEQEIETLTERRVELKYASDELQKKLIRVGNLISVDELDALRAKGTELENRMKALQDELAKSYDIVPFAIAANTLGQVVEQVKAEEEYKAVQFKHNDVADKTEAILDDLIQEQKACPDVIKRQVQDFYFSTISKLIKKHFFADVPDFKEDFLPLYDFTGPERSGLQTLLNNLRLSFREQFRHLTFQYNQTRTELGQVRRRVTDAESSAEDEVVKADRDQKARLDQQIEDIDRKIGGLDVLNDQLRAEIAQKEKQRSELTRRLRVSREDKAKDRLSEGLVKTLREYIRKYKDQKKHSLEDQILKGLHKLMHKQGFVDDVKVNILEEDIDIDLLDKRKSIIPKGSLSKGEQQLYATALLYGLVEESDIKFPIFIDSPMQKFDDNHARNIIKHFYPTIADQVVLFPLINKELAESEYSALLPNVARSYLIVNHDSDRSEFLEVVPKDLFKRHNELSEN